MEFKSNGENLTSLELQEIADNYIVSKHARKRLKERHLEETEVKNIVLNPYLAYFNTDESINILKDEFFYLVFGYDKNLKKFILITYKEPSKSNISAVKKQMFAKLGLGRIPKTSL